MMFHTTKKQLVLTAKDSFQGKKRMTDQEAMKEQEFKEKSDISKEIKDRNTEFNTVWDTVCFDMSTFLPLLSTDSVSASFRFSPVIHCQRVFGSQIAFLSRLSLPRFLSFSDLMKMTCTLFPSIKLQSSSWRSFETSLQLFILLYLFPWF